MISARKNVSLIPLTMRFNFKSFLTFLTRNKFYTAINIFGFAVSLMFVILFGLYLQREYSVDEQHVNKERVYRLVYNESTGWPYPTGADLMARYPEIEAAVAVGGANGKYRLANGELINDVTILADTAFFDVFTFEFIEGNARDAFRTKQDIVISESFARNYMGDGPLLGKMLKSEENQEFFISGVVRNIENSHMDDIGVFLPFANMVDITGWDEALTSYGPVNYAFYLMAKPGADLPGKVADMEDFFLGDERYWHFSNNRSSGLKLEPLQEVYFSPHAPDNAFRGNDGKFLSAMGIGILAVLLFAVINYINLTVAQTGFRAKEACIRRLLGSNKSELFLNFILESIIFCVMAFLIALGLAWIFTGWFQGLMTTDVTVGALFTSGKLMIVIAGLILLGIISGIVPAVMVSRFKPIEVVRGTFTRKTKMVYSKVLIAFQYCITIILIGCTVTIIRQVNFMTKSDMGFDHDTLIAGVHVLDKDQQNSFRDKMMSISGVEAISLSRSVPFTTRNVSMFSTPEGVTYGFHKYEADPQIFDVLGLKIVQEFPNANPDAVYVNETAWRKMALPEGVYEFKGTDWFQIQIKGVVKDFHTYDFTQPIAELMIKTTPDVNPYYWGILIRISSADPFGTYRRIEQAYNEFFGGNVFGSEMKFMDQAIAKSYKTQTRLSGMLKALSVLAVIISSMGMLAMATYFMRQRGQEVAVRKVFGSTNRQVLVMLMSSFMKLVVLAFVLSVPVIWFLMREWLTAYTYRIPITWNIFALAGTTVLLIAGLTVFWQAAKAANANPILYVKD